MFIITGKLSRKKALIIAAAALLILAVVLASVLQKDGKADAAAALRSLVRDNDERVAYLSALGWQVEPEPMETQSILIPREMSEAYAEYRRLQSEQGFDLAA